MTDLTEQNQWEDGIYQLERSDVVDAGENGAGVANRQAKELANRTAWLKARTEIRGDWDMTNTVTELAPDPANDFGGASAIVDVNNQTFTPAGPLSDMGGGQYLSGCFATLPTKKHQLRWSRLRMPDLTGSNLGGFGLALFQVGDSFTDGFMKLNGVGIAPGDGSYALFLQVMSGFVVLIYTADGEAPVTVNLSVSHPAWSAPAVDEDLFLGVDFRTGKVYVDKTGGEPLQVAQIDFGNEQAGLTTGLGLVFGAATPTFPEGPINFDFGTTAGGRLPFAQVADAELPAGAQDLYRYRVTAGGLFGDKETKAGDIVELRDGMADLIITRYPDPDPVQIEDVVSIADERIAAATQPIIQRFLDRREVWGVANDDPGTSTWVDPKDGDAVIVGDAPNGDFLSYTTGTLLIKDGDLWQEFTPWPGMELQPIVNAQASSQFEAARLERWVYLPNHDASWDQGVSNEPLIPGAPDPKWFKVRALGEPLTPYEVDLNDGDAFAILSQHNMHRKVKANVAGDVSILFGGGATFEDSGLLYLYADTAGGAEVGFSCTDAGGMTFSGFRRAGNDALPTSPCLHLNEGESAVLRWVTDATAGSAHLVLLGDNNETDQLKVITVTNGDTVTLTEAHHVINVLTNTAAAIAAATIELPFGEVLGAPIIFHVTHGIDAVTWRDTHAGANSVINSLPTKLNAGDAYAIYGGTNTSMNWVAIPLHHAATRKYQRPYDVATITMIEGERIAHIVGDTAGNRTVKLPPNPVKGDMVEIVKDTSVALDIIVQESDGSAVETVVTGATTGRLTFYWGMDDASPGSDAWRRMPAYF